MRLTRGVTLILNHMEILEVEILLPRYPIGSMYGIFIYIFHIPSMDPMGTRVSLKTSARSLYYSQFHHVGGPWVLYVWPCVVKVYSPPKKKLHLGTENHLF